MKQSKNVIKESFKNPKESGVGAMLTYVETGKKVQVNLLRGGNK